MTQTPTSSNNGRYTAPLPIFSQEDWDNVHDALVLALDALGDGPSTTDKAFVSHNLRYVNTQLKRSYRRAQKWAERVRRQQTQKEQTL